MLYAVSGEKIEKSIFVLLLASTLLVQAKIPHTQYGIHNVLLPLFSIAIIGIKMRGVGEAVRYHRRAFIFIGLLYVWMWISAFHSDYQSTAFKYCLKYTSYPLILASFMLLTFRLREPIAYFRLILYFLLFLAFFGLIEHFLFHGKMFQLIKPPSPGAYRVSSLMQNPNPYGALMTLGVILGIFMRNEGRISHAEFYISSFLFPVAVFFSGSKNAFITLLVGIIIIFSYRSQFVNVRSGRWLLVLAGIIILLILPLFLTVSSDKPTDHFHQYLNHFLHDESSGSNRLIILKKSIDEITKHPLLGVGIGVFPSLIKPNLPDVDASFIHTHNLILNILTEMGFVGLALSTLCIFHLWRFGQPTKPLVLVPVIVLLVSQIFDYFMHDVVFAAIAFFFFAVMANREQIVYEPK